jgi:hypothetical protein
MFTFSIFINIIIIWFKNVFLYIFRAKATQNMTKDISFFVLSFGGLYETTKNRLNKIQFKLIWPNFFYDDNCKDKIKTMSSLMTERVQRVINSFKLFFFLILWNMKRALFPWPLVIQKYCYTLSEPLRYFLKMKSWKNLT